MLTSSGNHFHQPLSRYRHEILTFLLEKKYTITFTWNRCGASLWSKMTTFQIDFLPPKNTGSPLTTSMFNTTCESFQMRYCMTFYLKGHQIYQNSKLKLPKKSAFINPNQTVLFSPLRNCGGEESRRSSFCHIILLSFKLGHLFLSTDIN